MNNDTTVGLYINGKQAERTLEILQKEADNLGKQLEEAVRRGDKAAQKQLNKSLKDVNQTIKQIQSSTKNVADVMARLDKATPHELRKTLTTLQNQLKHIERGSSAWTEHMAKIKMVKAELDKVNAEMKESESLLVRMRNGVQNWGAMAAGAVAAFSGIVVAGKKAVQTYAEMQQEEANVRKYTGMTEEEVTHLNEAFKKMDTRTSREELNKLAQEAGRLGMQSEEDVLGFVRAADKINVALDDLGEGATLTLSKLTDIFGDRQRLGTEQSLLAVGSVINELSQNCTASAPYLAEFAQRLAGVGAQAHMSVPEIMGFGAVLDSQGQKLEMSATALSKVIMNLFKDPAKIAQATGLSIEQFSETCKKSTNEGLLMLLDRLHELGGIDTLAPVFKDMGENGARASAVLAALAGNVDMVRQQQEAANVAFNEAVSIDKEFAVQNTTVQAGLEKARKRFTEMSVTLGKELMPIVTKIISSTSMTMRLMLKTIEFVKKYRIEILGAAAALATYYGIVKAKEVWDTFVGGCQKAIAAVKAFNKALLSNPYAAVGALIVGIGIALMGYIKRSKEAATAADAHRKALERQQEAERKTASAVGEVIGKYQQLKAEWERLSTAQEKKAWLDKNRDAFEQLGLHINNAVEADDAFVKSSEKVVEALKARARAEALQDLYKEKMKEAYEKAQSEGGNNTVVDTNSAVNAQVRAAAGVSAEDERWSSYSDATGTHSMYEGLTEEGAKKVNEYYRKKAEEDVARLTQQYTGEVEDMYGKMYSTALGEAQKAANATGGLMGDKPTKVNPNPEPVEGAPDEKELKKQHDAALKEVEDWKKKEMAINQIAYLKGEKDHCDYNDRSHEIDVEYWNKRMAVEKEDSAEYLEAKAKWLEAQKKQDEFYTKGSIEEEQKNYAELKATVDQSYADGKISAKTYQLALEKAELDHLKVMAELYDEGSEEWLKAQEKYQARSLQYQRKHAEDAKRIQERLQKDYFSKVGMTTNTESYEEEKLQLEAVRQIMMAQATADQKLQIEEAYQKAKYELAKKYNDEAGMMAVDAAQASVDQVLEYMKTDAFQGFYQSFSTLVSGMGEIFSGLSSLIDAEVTLQERKINKKYEAELKAAEGNAAETERIEAEKEKEIAAMKNEAEEKKYGMQIASTIAQTAIAAVNAYSSAAAIPIVGWIMGPIAAGMAVAAGGIQLMTLKKQHEAAMAQGYAAGGYTMPGSKYQPAGIVHAGEWVASQELLANPTAAATIAQLDQAQRTNTIGQLSKPAPVVSAPNPGGSAGTTPGGSGAETRGDRSAEAIERLNRTLDNGIYAATTMTGDKGILRQQRRYEQLMRNKSKK